MDLKKILRAEFISFASIFLLMIVFSEWGENLLRTKGHYHGRRFIFFFLAFNVLLFLKLKWQQVNIRLDSERFLYLLKQTILGILIYWFYKQTRDPRVIYASTLIPFQVINGIIVIQLIYLFFKNKIQQRKSQVPVFLVILGLILTSRVLVLILSPAPHIDVFTSNTDAAISLLSGQNPYLQVYQDIYQNHYDYKAGFAYWPGVAVLQSMSYGLFGDIRWIHLILEVLSAWFLFKLLRRTFVKSTSVLLTLLWLSFPVSNFVLEQAWVDSMLISLFLIFFTLLMEKRLLFAGFIIGIFVSIKQYAGFVPILVGMQFLGTKRYNDFIKIVISSLSSFFLVMLPFLLDSPQGFFEMSIKVPLSSEFRADSFSFVNFLHHNGLENIPSLFFSLPGLITLVIAVFFSFRSSKIEQTIFWIFLVYAMTFFFGKQAFCNYWHYAGVFLFLTIIYMLKEKMPQDQFLENH